MKVALRTICLGLMAIVREDNDVMEKKTGMPGEEPMSLALFSIIDS